MKNKFNFSFLLFVSLIFLTLFKSWFIGREIIGGDWPYFFQDTLSKFGFFPPAWSVTHGGGLGGMITTYFLDQYLYSIAFVFTNILQMPWTFIYKIFWFGLFIALSIFSSSYLLRTVFSQAKLWQMGLAALIFTTNTYILMVVGGGQLGVGLAYSIAPLVLARFLMMVRNPKLKIQNSLVASLSLAVQVMFDPRIAYMTILAVVGYYLINKFQISNLKFQTVSVLYTFIIPVGIATLLHSYWLFPLLVTGAVPIPEGFVSVSGFEFFSFANLSHSLSLLHPNWPENIFGKVYFMKPEFLILPIIAFSSLLFTKNKAILFFSFLGLLGAFLAKGANPPFEEINIWFFENLPGMSVFRDPSKFYLLIAISYSMLIPHVLDNFIDRATVLSKKIVWLLAIAFIAYWIITIRPAVVGNLGGTFVDRHISEEYVQLKDWLVAQKTFFRTLWVPRQHRFTFTSQLHPSVEAGPLLGATDSASLVKALSKSDASRQLEYLGIQYIIVPYDVYGEIFQEDRRYSPVKRAYIEKALDNIDWIKKVKSGEITVYKTLIAKDHFWTKDGKGIVAWKMLSDDRYIVDISLNAPDELMFSEAFHPGWRANIGDKGIPVQEAEYGMMSFALPKGTYTAEIEFTPRRIYLIGRVVSLTTVFVVGLYLVIQSISKRKKTL